MKRTTLRLLLDALASGSVVLGGGAVLGADEARPAGWLVLLLALAWLVTESVVRAVDQAASRVERAVVRASDRKPEGGAPSDG